MVFPRFCKGFENGKGTGASVSTLTWIVFMRICVEILQIDVCESS